MPYQDPLVCTDCINDSGIQDFIKQNKTEGTCSFCDDGESPSAPLDDVAEHMEESLKYEYDDALEWFVYDYEEQDLIGDSWDTWDLLMNIIELDLPTDYDATLLQEIISRLPQRKWCHSRPYDVPEGERVRHDWAWFSEVVKHRRRFFFEDFGAESPGGRLSPAEFLEKIFRYTENLELFRTLPSGSILFRARFQEPGEEFKTARELGPPPRSLANHPNRMSPPGIPMFYGCDDPGTALRETAKGPGNFAVASFKTLRLAVILDLTEIRPVPSLFEVIPETLEFRPRDVLTFLNHVGDEISAPVQGDDRTRHVDYIPTQVVTEFLRSKLTTSDALVDGIKYRSAVHPEHPSYVIFATQDNLLSVADSAFQSRNHRWLELASRCEENVSKEDIEHWKKQIPEQYREDYQKRLFGDE